MRHRFVRSPFRRAVTGLPALLTTAAVLVAVSVAASPAAAATFTNTDGITVNDATCVAPGPATPYPSNIAVSGLAGTVASVEMTLTGVTHPFQGDLELLLVSPAGGTRNLVVLSDAGTGALTNATVTLSDAAPGPAPQNTPWAPGSYQPTNYTELSGPDPFPSPAPAPSGHATFAAAFNGIDPNGTWSLYVLDDGCGDSGSIAGWSLDITTAAAAATTTTVTSAPNPSRTGQAVAFTATVTSGGVPVTTGTVTFSEGATVLAAGVPVNGSGQASFSTATLGEGDHAVTAAYNGTGSFGPSSAMVNQRVDNNTVVTGTTYCNPGPVTLPALGTATPYPSNIFVSGYSGTMARLLVSLKNVTHSFGGDLDVLLAGPTGQAIVLASDAGTAGVSNVTVDFDGAAASGLPATGSWGAPGSTVTVKPTDHVELDPDAFPAPAPAPTTTTLGSFGDTSPNGTWSLFVVDDGAPDAGSIAGGWCLTAAPKASPTITTTASPGGPLGTAVHDTATVSGGASPTGTVTFRLFSDPVCLVEVFSSTVPLAGGTATSASFTPTVAGTYRWTAVYSGDANNNPATSPCNAPNESVTIDKASPTITTTASPGGPAGTPVHDTATVSGGASPTGTVTFRLFSDPACTTEVFSSTVPLVGGTATSASFIPTAPGTYRWTAVYSGDANNNPATSPCNAPNESVTITLAQPTLTTQASPGNLVGAPVRDVATLSGGANPTGTVTFRLFSDNTCATQVFTSTNPVIGTTATSDWFTPAAPGTYWWTAVYSGDVNNNPATSPCQAPNESVTLAPFTPPPFTRTITGDFEGPLTVGPGESVLVTGARVQGPVTVRPGGALTVVASNINRGLTADNPSFLSVCSSDLAGPPPNAALTVTNASVPIRIGDPAAGCPRNRFAGAVHLSSNLALTFGANYVAGSVNVTGNGPGPAVVKANIISAALACSGNTPPPTNAGQVNGAGSKTGQCAAL